MSALLAVALTVLAAAALVGGPAQRHRRVVVHPGGDGWPPAVGPQIGERGRRSPAGSGPPWASPAVPPMTRVAGAALLTLAGTAIGWSAGLPAGLALPLAAGPGVAGFILLARAEPVRHRRRREAVERQTALTLELLAGCVQAGLPLRQATACVAATVPDPIAGDLRVVLSAVDLGLSDGQAWGLLRGHPTLGGAADDVIRTVDTGALLVGALLQHARQARERRHAARETAAKSLGVRCVLPMMICFIPAFLLLGVVPTVVSAFLAAVPDIVGR